MGRILLVLSFLSLVVISIGTTIAAQSPLFWLASTGVTYEDVRLVLCLFLVLQIASQPPRYIWFRLVSGSVASIAGLWVIAQTLGGQMFTLDSLSLMSACIAILVTSLEIQGNLRGIPYVAATARRASLAK